MPRKKTPLRERILAKTEEQDGHLIWKGAMYRGQPRLTPIGNPARVLFNLEPGNPDHSRIQIKPTCSNPRCINIYHWEWKLEDRTYWAGLPPPKWQDPRQKDKNFTNRELEEIEEVVRDLQNGEMTIEEVEDGGYPPKMREEIIRRVQS